MKINVLILSIIFFISSIFTSFAMQPNENNLADPNKLSANSDFKFDVDDRIFKEYEKVKGYMDRRDTKISFSFDEIEEDKRSRLVRVYSYPALFSKDCGIIKDLNEMLHEAVKKDGIIEECMRSNDGEINEERKRAFEKLAVGYSERIDSNFSEECRGVGYEPGDAAFRLFGVTIANILSCTHVEHPSWLDRHFHVKETKERIKAKKSLLNVLNISTLLIFEIAKEEWKDKDFLITAYDHVESYKVDRYWFNPLKLILGSKKTVPCPEWQPASVHFYKSNPPLYRMPYDENELLEEFGNLHLKLLGLLRQCLSNDQSGDVQDVRYHVKSEEDRRKMELEIRKRDDEINKLIAENEELKNRMGVIEAELNSIIDAIRNLSPEQEQQLYGNIHQAVNNYMNAVSRLRSEFENNKDTVERRMVAIIGLIESTRDDIITDHVKLSEEMRNIRDTFTGDYEIIKKTASEKAQTDIHKQLLESYRKCGRVGKFILRSIFPQIGFEGEKEKERDLECIEIKK